MNQIESRENIEKIIEKYKKAATKKNRFLKLHANIIHEDLESIYFRDFLRKSSHENN